jgi:hypothetical protein
VRCARVYPDIDLPVQVLTLARVYPDIDLPVQVLTLGSLWRATG